MPAPITAILPTRNSAAQLPATFEGLMEGVYAGLIAELLVADAGSTDETLSVSRAVGAEIHNVAEGVAIASLGGLMPIKGRWMLIVPPGAVLQRGWVTAVEEFLESEPKGWGYFKRSGKGAAWSNIAASVFGRPSTATAQLRRAKGGHGRARAINAYVQAL